MGDRLCDDLGTALSWYSKQNIDTFYDDEETEEYYEYDDVNDDFSDGRMDELACPFCLEDFDVLGLCCHIDSEHRIEVKHGKHRSAQYRSAISMLRKELQEKHLHCLKEPCPKEPSTVDSSSDVAADFMLLSFIHNSQPAKKPEGIRATSFTEASLSGKSSDDNFLERIQPSPSTDSGQEKARRHEFLQGLLFPLFLTNDQQFSFFDPY